jgi:hypothetical protein
MQSVYLPAFYLGVYEELQKHARCWEGYEPVPGKEPYSEDSCRPKRSKKEKKEKKASTDINSMPVNENILPNIDRQAKWKYVRTKDGLKLTDGNLVYSFGGFPEEYPAEDTRISRITDDNILNFENEAISKGTAQIHRSSPDNIYMTLATGGDNPTFMLQHEGGQNWRYSPSKKFLAKLKAMQSLRKQEEPQQPLNQEQQEIPDTPASMTDSVLIDPMSLTSGAVDSIKQAFDMSIGEGLFNSSTEAAEAINSGLAGIGNFGKNLITDAAEKPFTSIAKSLMLGKAISAIRDKINPSRVDDRMMRRMTQRGRTDGLIWPLVGAATPVLAGSAIMAK